jgi:hypothetical protein
MIWWHGDIVTVGGMSVDILEIQNLLVRVCPLGTLQEDFTLPHRLHRTLPDSAGLKFQTELV